MKYFAIALLALTSAVSLTEAPLADPAVKVEETKARKREPLRSGRIEKNKSPSKRRELRVKKSLIMLKLRRLIWRLEKSTKLNLILTMAIRRLSGKTITHTSHQAQKLLLRPLMLLLDQLLKQSDPCKNPRLHKISSKNNI